MTKTMLVLKRDPMMERTIARVNVVLDSLNSPLLTIVLSFVKKSIKCIVSYICLCL